MFDILPMRDRKVVRRFVGVRCEAVADRDFRLIGRVMRDLSVDGAFVETEVPLETDELVYLSFQAPRTTLWVDACALVARVVRGRRGSDHGKRGVGLLFVSMDPGDRALLEACLCRMPLPVPERKLRLDYAGAVRSVAAR